MSFLINRNQHVIGSQGVFNDKIVKDGYYLLTSQGGDKFETLLQLIFIMKKYVIGLLVFVAVFSTGTLVAKAESMDIGQLVNLLIQLGVISPDKADAARAAVANSNSTSSSGFCHTWNTNLKYGDKGDGRSDLAMLQDALNREGFSVPDYVASGVDSSTVFEDYTAAAVVKFQGKYGIPQTGYVGPLTRARLNSLYGCSAQNTVKTNVTPAVTNSQTVNTTSNNPLAPSLSVNISSASITTGQSALLKWNSVNANRCVLKYGPSEENISVNGTKTLAPLQTTTYQIWCVNDPGTGKDGPATERYVTLYVSAPTLATPSISFYASQSTIGAVQNSVLSWSTSNANRCVLQYGSSEINVDANRGSLTVSPSQTTSYRLICTNDPGTGKDGPSAERTVSVAVATPSCSLTTNKSSYNLGESIILSWTSQNATYTTFKPDTSGKDNLYVSGDKNDTSGSYTTTANVSGNPSVTMLVYNHYGSNSCSITVPVN